MSGLENSIFGTGQVSGVARAYTVLGQTGVVFVYVLRLLTSLSFSQPELCLLCWASWGWVTGMCTCPYYTHVTWHTALSDASSLNSAGHPCARLVSLALGKVSLCGTLIKSMLLLADGYWKGLAVHLPMSRPSVFYVWWLNPIHYLQLIFWPFIFLSVVGCLLGEM